jgi:adenosylhomocysteine nucleosidase
MDRSNIGFVVGLAAEAALLKNTGFMVGVGGGTPLGAARAAADLIANGAGALISFGLAGGLNPELPAGTIIIPAMVNEYICDPGLVAWLGGVTHRKIFAGDEIVITIEQKSTLFTQTQADAIDLESGAVAAEAAQAKIPFAVLRAIADPATRTLPPAALIALNAGGEIRIGPILASLARNPRQLPALLALARDAAKARKALVQKIATLT